MNELHVIARVAQGLLALAIVAGMGAIFEYGYYFA